MKRTFLFVTVLAVAALGTTARADIRFGFAAEPYPPFLSKDASGQWVGWEADLMAAICTDLKEKCSSAEVAWDGLIPALESKQFDVIWSSMAITPKRREVIGFTTAYYNTRIQMMGTRTGDTDISPAHLAGKAIGTQVATIHQRYVEHYFKPAGAALKTYQTQDEANQDLAAGRIDYVEAAAPAIAAFLASDMGKACCEMKGDVPWDDEIFGEGVGGGLRKDDAALKQKLDGAIADLAKAGTFDQITAKYPGLAGLILTPKK
jgi:polar amino acid transport system substrate-binding protein